MGDVGGVGGVDGVGGGEAPLLPDGLVAGLVGPFDRIVVGRPGDQAGGEHLVAGGQDGPIEEGAFRLHLLGVEPGEFGDRGHVGEATLPGRRLQYDGAGGRLVRRPPDPGEITRDRVHLDAADGRGEGVGREGGLHPRGPGGGAAGGDGHTGPVDGRAELGEPVDRLPRQGGAEQPGSRGRAGPGLGHVEEDPGSVGGQAGAGGEGEALGPEADAGAPDPHGVAARRGIGQAEGLDVVLPVGCSSGH